MPSLLASATFSGARSNASIQVTTLKINKAHFMLYESSLQEELFTWNNNNQGGYKWFYIEIFQFCMLSQQYFASFASFTPYDSITIFFGWPEVS